MTRQETAQILTLLAGNYESFAKKTETDQQVKIMLNIWQECLKDLEYKIVLQSVKKTIITSPYPPTIYEIRKNAVEMINPTVSRTAIEAWNEAYSMICRGLYMTEEQFEIASPEVKKFFSSARQVKEMAMTDTDIVNSVIKGQFLKQYEIIVQRENEQKLLPKEMQDFTKKLVDRFDVSGSLKKGEL